MLFQEIWSSYESLMKRDHWKKNYYGHFLTALKAFKTERELHHCLTTLKVFNSEKGLHHLFRTLKVFNIEKELHHFLETLKGFNFEKWVRHILITRKVYQNSCSVECWWTAASEVRLSYHIYDQRTSTALSAQFHSNRNMFPFWGQIYLEWGDLYLF